VTLVDNGLEILSPEECRDLLRLGEVGRVAVTVAALPAIFPVNATFIGYNISRTIGLHSHGHHHDASLPIGVRCPLHPAHLPHGGSL
jgi:hypothetical protein